MTDMKLDKDDLGPSQPAYASDAGPCYPCGLSIHMDDDELTKLGIEKLPEVGAVMTLNAKVQVVRVAEENGMYGRIRSLGLQITAMDLKTGE